MKLDDRFNTEDFRQIRSHAAQSLLSSQKLVDAEDVFDFFETVGLLVRQIWGFNEGSSLTTSFFTGSTCTGWQVKGTFKKSAKSQSHCGSILNTRSYCSAVGTDQGRRFGRFETRGTAPTTKIPSRRRDHRRGEHAPSPAIKSILLGSDSEADEVGGLPTVT